MNSAPQVAKVLARLSRPQNVVYPGLLSLEMAWLQGRPWYGRACYLLLFCLYAVAASYNSLRDQSVDRMNKRQDNPLADKKLSTRTVYSWIGLNGLFILVLQSLLIQPAGIIITLCYLLLLGIYSDMFFKIQSRGFLAPLLMSI